MRGEDLLDRRERVGVLVVVGLQRRDVEVAVDRLARIRVGLHQLAQRRDRRGEIATAVIDGRDVEERDGRELRLGELGDDAPVELIAFSVSPAFAASVACLNKSAVAT